MTRTSRPERAQMYQWIAEEEVYADEKFDDERNGHDDRLKEGLDTFWYGQVTQYYDRATIFLREAKVAYDEGNYGQSRELQMRGQQALAKALMTAKGLVESSIRVFGPLPQPGVPSGDIAEWGN